MEKTCKYCGIKKSFIEFHKNKNSKDGTQSKCKECVSAYWKEYHAKNGKAFYVKNKERIRERTKKYAQTPKGKENYRLGSMRHKEKYPDRIKARTAAYQNIKIAGRNCEICGGVERLQRHHHLGYDFENRLNIKILCASCHNQEHNPARSQQP